MKDKFLPALGVILTISATACVREEMPQVAEPSSHTLSIRADAVSPTRTSLGEDADGGAAVLWRRGDAFRLFGVDASGNVTGTVDLVTSEDGKSSAEFTAQVEDDPSGTVFYAGYPAERFAGLSDGKLLATIPSKQTAAAGDISTGQHLSVVRTDAYDAGITFLNVSSLLKFSLAGSEASSITRVTITADAALAGDFSVDLSGEVPVSTAASTVSTYKSASWYEPNEYTPFSENASKTVTLEGTFEAGTSYYISVLPGTYYSLTIRLEDEFGRYMEKKSTRGATFRRSVVHNLGTFQVSSLSNPAAHQVMRATKGAKPVTLVFLSQGFAEGADGRNDRLEYDAAVREECDFLFSTAPLSAYKEYFNVYALFNAASGVDDTKGCVTSPFTMTETSTSFSLGDSDEVFRWVKENCPDIADGSHAITEVPIFMLVNWRTYHYAVTRKPNTGSNVGAAISMVTRSCDRTSTAVETGYYMLRYGNATYTEAASVTASAGNTRSLSADELLALGYLPFTLNGETVYRTKVSWRNAVLHEGIGHGLGRLVDDYWGSNTQSNFTYGENYLGHNLNPKDGLNISSSRTTTPWADFETVLKTYTSVEPRYARHSLYQGGFTSYMFGVWRPEAVSCMVDSRPYFGAYERYLISERIMVLSGSVSGQATGKEHADWPFSEFFKMDLAVDGPRDDLRD